MGTLGVVVWLVFGIPIAVLAKVTSSPFLMVVVVALAAVLYAVHVERKEREREEQARFFPGGKIHYR